MLKMFRAQAFQAEHAGKPLLLSNGVASVEAPGTQPVQAKGAERTHKRYRRNLQLITSNSHVLMPHSGQAKADGAGTFLEGIDAHPLPTFEILGAGCDTESLEASFVPLSVSPNVHDELSLDSLSNFDESFDSTERMDGDQELISWLTMDACDSAGSALEKPVAPDEPKPPIPFGCANGERQLTLAKRDVRATPYARRSARRHHVI
jgi:hypothetical protein